MSNEPTITHDIIDSRIQETKFTGVILVTRESSMIYGEAFGMANRSEAIPNRIDTRFAVASGSKIFTGIGICQLVEQGLISFESRLRDCLDIDFPNHDPDITIHHLLTHSSGIPDYFDESINPDYEALWKDRPMYRMREPRDFLPLFSKDKMKFTPGSQFCYSDGGFILLGLVIEQQTGIPFTQYVQKNIFARCGMNDCGYFFSDQLPARTACHYIEEKDGFWRTNIFSVPVIGAPDGGAYVTAPNMRQFWSVLLSGQLIGKALTERMLTPYMEAVDEGEDIFYGLGVWLKKRANRALSYYVTGWDPGVAMISRVIPDKNLHITVLGNANKPTFPAYRVILEALGEM